mmetsp:Transcript_31030/g.106738  ORF Transcript_31030/g.106738 Transcript_31030/m.106738 type:complete len:212 (+) Transcript_31030:280-915(+)
MRSRSTTPAGLPSAPTTGVACFNCAQSCARLNSAVAASSILWWSATQPLPPSQASTYWSSTSTLYSTPAAVASPTGSVVRFVETKASCARFSAGVAAIAAARPTSILRRIIAGRSFQGGLFEGRSVSSVTHWLGFNQPICELNTCVAMSTSAGCATQVPSWPLVASRTLSSRATSSAAALASKSFLIGICVAMPPMARAPRLWQTRISSLE